MCFVNLAHHILMKYCWGKTIAEKMTREPLHFILVYTLTNFGRMAGLSEQGFTLFSKRNTTLICPVSLVPLDHWPKWCITPDSLVYTLLQKKGNFKKVGFLFEKSVITKGKNMVYPPESAGFYESVLKLSTSACTCTLIKMRMHSSRGPPPLKTVNVAFGKCLCSQYTHNSWLRFKPDGRKGEG